MAFSQANVLVCGSVGSGKTTMAAALSQATGMNHVDVAALIREERLYDEVDDDYNCTIFDDDKVADAVADRTEQGGNIVDFHSVGIFGEDWFDLVLILRADTAVLWDRLAERGYTKDKVRTNVECEIFEIVPTEAKEQFGEHAKVIERPNENEDDKQETVAIVTQWLRENQQ